MITVTDAAQTQLNDLIAKQGEGQAKPALRVFVQGGGCGGMQYGMGLDDQPQKPGDEIYEAGGIKVVVDAFSQQYLDGAEIHYVDEMMGGGFTINNPNATSTCGCGHSFQTADQAGQPKSCSH